MSANWYSPWLPPPGDLYVNDPQHLGSGSASLLPMTDAEKEVVARKPKRPLGFAALDQASKQDESPASEPPMWELG